MGLAKVGFYFKGEYNVFKSAADHYYDYAYPIDTSTALSDIYRSPKGLVGEGIKMILKSLKNN